MNVILVLLATIVAGFFWGLFQVVKGAVIGARAYLEWSADARAAGSPWPDRLMVAGLVLLGFAIGLVIFQ
jgi:hypothetical protein